MGLSARAALDRDLRALREDLLKLGNQTSQAILSSMQSLSDRDHERAEEIIENDDRLNALRYKIEESCLGMIATRQPTARDLRAIVAAMNIAGDLERMGDHAAGIAKISLLTSVEESLDLPGSLTKMVTLVHEMLGIALEAYRQGDDHRAYSVATKDDLIDEQYKTLFRELVELIGKKPEITSASVYLMFVGHNLERIADRATNIAERVVFMTSGEMRELNPEPGASGTN